jgi:glycosyltransferase involved in cell wall biosynthesis
MKRDLPPKILFINAGATITGVPIYFINLIGWLKENTDFEISILTAFDGPLAGEYIKLAPTFRWDGANEPSKFEQVYLGRLFFRIINKIIRFKNISYQEQLISKLKSENFDLIYINSVASLFIFDEIRKFIHTKTILHVHELQMSIMQFCGSDLLKSNLPFCDHLIAISKAVALNLKKQFDVPEEYMSVVYTFIDIKKSEKTDTKKYREIIRNQLGIPQEAFVVGSSGTTDWRKGADLIIQIALKVRERFKKTFYFIWIGGDSSGLEYQKLNYDIERAGLKGTILFLGIKNEPLEYFSAIDVFMLCSREEPVGIVALESASLKKPVLCFDQSGGCPEFVEDDCGYVVPYLNLDFMADRIIYLAENELVCNKLGRRASEKVKLHDISIACEDIARIIKSKLYS